MNELFNFCHKIGKCMCVRVSWRSKMAESVMFGLICLLMVDVGRCAIYGVDSNTLLKNGIRTESAKPSVGLMWGIADTTASVGRFFNYSIPHDAFKGNNLVYKVTEAGKDFLPHWLTFDQKKQLLQGLPCSSDVGQYDIKVVVSGLDSAEAKDTFSIFVTEDTGNSGPVLYFREHGPKTVRCKRSEPETSVRIVIDTDLNSLDAAKRLQLHKNIMSHLNLAEDMLKINEVGKTPLTDASALVSGSGDAKILKTPGSFVSWLVGCGKVEPDHMSVLQQVETDSSNGMLSNAIGQPVHVWHVTNTRFQEHKRRKRAAVRPTVTPAVTPTLPVKGPTHTIKATATDHETLTRSVPTFTSPSFGIQPTKTMTMEKTKMPEGGTAIVPTKAPDGGVKPSSHMPHEGMMTKTQVLPTKTYVMTDEVVPTKTTPKPTDTEGEATKPPVEKCKDQLPSIVNPIKDMKYFVGTPIKFKIPENTFYDCRVGNTRKLTLNLFSGITNILKPGFWIKFDRNKQVMSGMPMSDKIGKHEFTLVAMNHDKADTPAAISFSIIIMEDPSAKDRNHELSVTMDYDYEEFSTSPDKQVSFMNKVARLYGERNAKQLSMTRIAKGSTVVAWTNKTLAAPGCPVEAIKALVGKLANEDGTPTKAAIKGLHPYVLKSARVAPLGDCEGVKDFPVYPTTGDNTPQPAPDGEDPSKTSSPEPTSTTEAVKTGGIGGSTDDIWITTVVPAVVTVAVLLLALLIACILYRKKRKGKMNLEDQNTFVNKGVPVIFQDELEEKPIDSSKPLLLEGQPPCPPPEYQRGDSQGSTPPVSHKQPNYEFDGDHIEDTNVNSPLYQPPPPVTASSGNNKPRPYVSQPAYRSQPPSIPP